MSDLRVGRVVRAVRRRERLRQEDVTAPIGIHRSVLTDLEAGRLEDVSLRTARRLCTRLGIELVVEARWRGGEIDRLLDEGHAAIVERVAAALTQTGWTVEPEFTFNEFGDRGSVDVLAWRPDRRALLLVEVKTAVTDLQAMLLSMSRKVRVVPAVVARDRGWERRAFGRVLVVLATSANRRVVRKHHAVFDAALPAGAIEVRQWIREPIGDCAGVWFISGAGTTRATTRVRRVSSRRQA
jgi:transcriptional regulator with XRE-family HTH domain